MEHEDGVVHQTFENDGMAEDICGYRQSRTHSVLTFIGYILSLGVLKVIFNWKPHWQLYATHIKCSLSIAEKVLVKDQYNGYHVESVKMENQFQSRGNSTIVELQNINSPPRRYFMYKKLKYEWIPEEKMFKLLETLEHLPHDMYHAAEPLHEEVANYRRMKYGLNSVTIPLTPIITIFFVKVLHPFYFFQIFTFVFWYYVNYYVYATVILSLTIASAIWQIVIIRNNEKRLHQQIHYVGRVLVCRNHIECTELIDSSLLVPGDIIEIPKTGCTMSCDAVLLTGSCVVAESMLTGESIPVLKTPLPCGNFETPETVSESREIIKHKIPSSHALLCGTEVLETRTTHSQSVRAFVTRTGFHTTKGELVRAILYPRPSNFQFNRDIYRLMLGLLVFSALGLIYTVTIQVRYNMGTDIVILRSLGCITIIVPPMLPLAMTIGLLFAQRRLKRKDIFCTSPNSTFVAGVTSVVCFDKTGTITDDGLSLWGVVPSTSSSTSPKCSPRELSPSPVIECMAACHSLVRIDGQNTGDPLDIIMFDALQWELLQEEDMEFKSISEESGVCPSVIVQPDTAYKHATNCGDSYRLLILKNFPFSSNFLRMSVIAINFHTKRISLYLKGSPEMVQTLCQTSSIPQNYSDMVVHYTKEGYRVIAMAWRQLDVNLEEINSLKRENLECDLLFCGLLIFQNNIRKESQPAISMLKQANIRTVMITGDNMLTAISVARNCDMIDEGQSLVVLTVDRSFQEKNVAEINGEEFLRFYYIDDLQHKTTTTTLKERFYGIVQKSMTRERIDPCDFSLAMSGTTWSFVCKHCVDILPKIVAKAVIMARFNPDQKLQAVEELQKLKYYVTMCGDGANDCGALKAAHAGISLSDNEASVASPFTSKSKNVSCVPILIQEGRCSLTTGFGIVKYMASYSIIQYMGIILLLWNGAFFGDYQFLYLDLFVTSILAITLSSASPWKNLHKMRPSLRIVGMTHLLYFTMQVILLIGIQIAAHWYISSQPWFLPLDPSSTEQTNNHITTAIFCISAFQYIILALVSSPGPPYRQYPFRNVALMVNLALVVLFTAYIVFYPCKWLTNVLQILQFPDNFIVKGMLVGLATIHFMTAMVLKLIFGGNWFRKKMLHFRRYFLKRFRKPPRHAAVNEEIRENISIWPMVIHANRIKDVPPDIFTDGPLTTEETKFVSLSQLRFSVKG